MRVPLELVKQIIDDLELDLKDLAQCAVVNKTFQIIAEDVLYRHFTCYSGIVQERWYTLHCLASALACNPRRAASVRSFQAIVTGGYGLRGRDTSVEDSKLFPIVLKQLNNLQIFSHNSVPFGSIRTFLPRLEALSTTLEHLELFGNTDQYSHAERSPGIWSALKRLPNLKIFRLKAYDLGPASALPTFQLHELRLEIDLEGGARQLRDITVSSLSSLRKLSCEAFEGMILSHFANLQELCLNSIWIDMGSSPGVHFRKELSSIPRLTMCYFNLEDFLEGAPELASHDYTAATLLLHALPPSCTTVEFWVGHDAPLNDLCDALSARTIPVKLVRADFAQEGLEDEIARLETICREVGIE